MAMAIAESEWTVQETSERWAPRATARPRLLRSAAPAPTSKRPALQASAFESACEVAVDWAAVRAFSQRFDD